MVPPDWFFAVGSCRLIASLVAIENPRRAGLLFLFVAPIMAACVAWSLPMSTAAMGVSVRRILVVFAATSLLFLIPGVFWLTTTRAGWPLPFIGSVFSKMYGESAPAPEVDIPVTGPAGTVTTTTDQQGV